MTVATGPAAVPPPVNAPSRPVTGWRAGVGASVAAAAADPAAWVLGLLTFLVRGGVVLLALPMLSIPSPVLLSMLFRGEVGSLTRDDLRLVALAVGLVLSVLAIGGVIVSAWAEVGLAERLLADPETDVVRRGRSPRTLTPAARRSLVWWVATVQAVAILPVIVVITWLVDGVVRGATDELMRPGDVHLPLWLRVLPALGPRLVVLLVVVLVVEALASLATRRLMVGAWGLLPAPIARAPAPPTGGEDRPGAGEMPQERESRIALAGVWRGLRRPGRTAATAIAGWLLIAGTAALVMIATTFAFAAVRDVLVGAAVNAGPAPLLASAVLLVLFSAVWLGGLGLLGFAAAARAGLWTVDALR